MQVLIVDDLPSQREIYRNLLEKLVPDIHITDYGDPVAALLWSQKHHPDLVVLDYRMPKMDGLEFVRRFRRPLSQRDVPIIFLTIDDSAGARTSALEAGVLDYIVKPVVAQDFRFRCRNLLEYRQQQLSLKWRANRLEHELHGRQPLMSHGEVELLQAWTSMLALRESSWPTDTNRLADINDLLAEAAGIDPERRALLRQAVRLHDIGMHLLAEDIAGKPTVFDADDRALLRRHCQAGHEVLRRSDSPLLQIAAMIALRHHERWDGQGYPDRLHGPDIPLEARVFAVADSLLAMTSRRPHRPAVTAAAALAEVESQGGQAFDPHLVELVRIHHTQLRRLLEPNAGVGG